MLKWKEIVFQCGEEELSLVSLMGKERKSKQIKREKGERRSRRWSKNTTFPSEIYRKVSESESILLTYELAVSYYEQRDGL